MRIMDVYYIKLEYGTKQFTKAIYCNYKQVIDNQNSKI